MISNLELAMQLAPREMTLYRDFAAEFVLVAVILRELSAERCIHTRPHQNKIGAEVEFSTFVFPAAWRGLAARTPHFRSRGETPMSPKGELIAIATPNCHEMLWPRPAMTSDPTYMLVHAFESVTSAFDGHLFR